MGQSTGRLTMSGVWNDIKFRNAIELVICAEDVDTCHYQLEDPLMNTKITQFPQVESYEIAGT